jgi:MFS family permease
MMSAPTAATAPLTALAFTLTVQALATLAQGAPSVLAPAMSAHLGVPAQHVGWLVSLAYVAAMLSGLMCSAYAPRYGPVRVSQMGLLGAGFGLLLLSLGQLWVLPLGALALGVGYGLPNPMAADILSRHAPINRRGFYFSIKQTGVPLGFALAGLLLPPLLAPLGWQGAVAVVGMVILLLAWLSGRVQTALEGERRIEPLQPTAPAAIGTLLRERLWLPLQAVFANPPVRRLGLTSFVYAMSQVVYLTFLVSMLNLELGFSLATAAALLAASQAVSMAARVFWGYVSDRWVDPARLIALLGLAMGFCLTVLGLAPPGLPWWVMLAITTACAATAVAWNGVFYADLVRYVTAREVAATTGATQFLTFSGGVFGTAVFAALVSMTGSYTAVFIGLGLLPALTGVVLLLSARRSSARKL